MAVSRRLRFEILRRDNHQCRYCGAAAPEVKLTVDHVVPTALGGSDEATNLVTACQPCNAGKAATSIDAPLVADIKGDALRWARAMEVAATARLADRKDRDKYVRKFTQAWTKLRWGIGHNSKDDEGEEFPRPSDWKHSIWRFYSVSLPVEELIDAAQIACMKRSVHIDDAFRYMCGVAWSKVTEIQEAASEVVATLTEAIEED